MAFTRREKPEVSEKSYTEDDYFSESDFQETQKLFESVLSNSQSDYDISLKGTEKESVISTI